MKTVILCGGLGTRLSEETDIKPKPMVEIGDRPILWHIMKIYGQYDYNKFVLALGYKGEKIKEYFINYNNLTSDLTVNLKNGNVSKSNTINDNWEVQMIDTGIKSMTGGRINRLEKLLRPDDRFMMTYGDGLGDINIRELVSFHKEHGKIATMVAVRPPARFGSMTFSKNQVLEFKEKPQTGEGWINGGFFIFESEIFKYLHGDDTVLEADPLEKLASDGQLMAYKHNGFWQCMDTLRDKIYLNKIFKEGNAPWKNWK